MIPALQAAFPAVSLRQLCPLLGISRSGVYAARHRTASTSAEVALRDAIERIVLEMPGYGYRRVTHELRRQGWPVKAKRVLRIMRQESLLCQLKRHFVVTTDSRHGWPVVPNLARGMQPNDLDQLWVADITYIRLLEQFAYLAVILDAFSRRVVGWAMADHLQASLAIDALKMAIKKRKPAPGTLMHHSDQGIQYACSEYTEVLAAHDITASMSRVGNPYDNAKAERFMRTLKTEQIDGTLFRDRHEAERSIGDFIERIYNTQRLHTALDYRSPAQFEAWHRARMLPGVGDAALDKGSATPTPDPSLDPKTRRAQAIT